MAEGLAARLAAVELLGAVLGDGRMLSEMLSELELPTELPPQERARAQRLALAVLRRLEPIDALLSPHLRKVPPMLAMNARGEFGGGNCAPGSADRASDRAGECRSARPAGWGTARGGRGAEAAAMDTTTDGARLGPRGRGGNRGGACRRATA